MVVLSNARYEQIKRIVVQMFEEHGVRSVPISGFEIDNRMGISVIPYSAFTPSKRELALAFSEDGFSGYENGEYRIAYNDDPSKPYGRVNFTLLHELGHVVLGHTEGSELADKEADFFAKFAQCPPVLIHKLELSDVGGIMSHFDISYGAASYALDYYHKWLKYGGRFYKDYEIRTCQLFGLAI